MLVPLSWLKEYVDIPVTPDELEEKLFSCGFEVEEKYEYGKDISGVVVCEVLECEAVPGTHLHVCQVDAGKMGKMQVMCGADNVQAGKKFPLALPGATVIKTGKDHVTVEGIATIEKGTLRGYESNGMLCSGTELGITDDFYPGGSYNGLLCLPDDAILGEDVKKLTGLDDIIFDVSITANRPDCQCIFGLAREVAAVLNTELREPATDYTESEVTLPDFKISVEAPELCPRYIGHYVSDVTIGESPAWMRHRLALVGLNGISNVVDITNYVLKELGQPMHAFDLSFLSGSEICVRRAKNEEKIVTLDEKEFTLNEKNLVICDGEKPVALAGIMGGLNSEIRETTKGVMFESAKFMRDNIRKSSRALGQSSDSSAVFSKGVNEYTTVMAMKRALHLIEELQCGKVSRTHFDINTGNSVQPRDLEVSLRRVFGVLGVTVPEKDVLRILKNLNFDPALSGDTLKIRIPGYREDMESYPDVAEELIRMYGYDHVQPTFMQKAEVTMGGRTAAEKTDLRLKRVLASKGAYEGIHYSFFSPKDLDLLRLPAEAEERKCISLINPINEDLSLMRTTLIPQMIHAMARNQKRGIYSGSIFEIGQVFLPKSLPLTEYPDEQKRLSIGTFGDDATFFTLKGFFETVAETLNLKFVYRVSERTYLHPGRTAEVLFNGNVIGVFGEVRYEIQEELSMRNPAYVGEVNLDALSEVYTGRKTFVPLPEFAEEKRDFAFVVSSDVTCENLEEAIREACEYITDVMLFDVYQDAKIGEDKKSMAFSVVFTPKKEAFTDAVLDGYVKEILAHLSEKYGAALRS